MFRAHKKSILFVLCFLLSTSAFSSHIMGGEITWECDGNNQYIFTLKVYRDCNGVNLLQNPQTLDVWNNPMMSSITVNFVDTNDISPACGSPCSNPGPGSAQEFIWKSGPITLTGTPPVSGWIFTWDLCCRNGAIDNLVNPDSYGSTLRAKMFPFIPPNDSIPLDAGQCYDSSPAFMEKPVTALCTGYNFIYNQNAYDGDSDSLFYDWGVPLDDLGALVSWPAPTIPFVAGYSATSPFPNAAQNPNNQFSLNPETGELNITNFTAGEYVSCIRVESWRCGQKISEVFRDLQTVYFGNCPPTFGAGLTNLPPSITITNSTFTQISPSLWVDTVYSGDSVSVNLEASDFDFLPNGTAPTVTISASGAQFGDNFTSPSIGCPFPPCAVLDTPTPVSSTFGSLVEFHWQTDCSNLDFSNSCSNQNTFAFTLKAEDDWCPAPAFFYGTFIVTILPNPNSVVTVYDTVCSAFIGPDGSIYDSSGVFQIYYPVQGSCDSIVELHLEVGLDSLVESEPTDQFALPGQATWFSVVAPASSNFQWQTDLGFGFQNLTNAGQYSGTDSDSLIVSNISALNNNQLFRCIVSNPICSDTSSTASLMVSGLGNMEYFADRLIIFPNPAIKTFHTSIDLPQGTKFFVFDSLGNCLDTGFWKGYYDVSHLPPGYYSFTFSNEGLFHVTKRLIVQ